MDIRGYMYYNYYIEIERSFQMAKRTPMKSIRAKCLECTNNQPKEIRLCPINGCPLYEYRMGHRPKDKEDITEID